ncbi:MAG TPA: Xaa-Pro peptidase family protein [Mycobacteriales bacterium]|nr:Xaa-Pro peptidase family protein [Mycobacteriales bacterium]
MRTDSRLATRRAAAVAALPGDVDAVLVTRPENVRYLSGFTGSNGALLLGHETSPVLATDGRYVLQAAAEAPDVEVVERSRVAEALVERAASAGMTRLGIEAHHLTVDLQRSLEQAGAGRVELLAAGRLVEKLRTIKDGDEVEALRRACAATDRAFESLLDRLRPGITERDAEWALITALREAGADGPSFPSIVAFGPNAAIPHHQPGSRPLARGDLIKLDFGALVDGYHADMTRTVVSGPAAHWQRDLHEAVRAIQWELSAAVAPGVVPADLDREMRRLLTAAGYQVRHGLGHGVGLEIHEDPFLTERSPAPALESGMVMTVEPGIYLEGHGGVRIEDTVLVGEGRCESLTTSSRDLIEC